ncbi:motility protein A [Clostridia bacterium]|nr:motility protein A [Clostridia bacterium]
MDIMGIFGLIMGVASIGVGMVLKGVSISALNNPAAILIIIAGTVSAVVIATPGSELSLVGKLFGIMFGKVRTFITKEEVIEIMMGLAEVARQEGILALEERAKSIEEPFIVRGIQMLTDGADSEYIASILAADIDAMSERHATGAQIFMQAGTYAPTLGVLGAVLGLIAALSDLSNVEKIGHAISAAFVATLLGIFTGYVLWFPMCNRLKRKSKQEVFVKGLMLEGIVGLSEGQNPRMLKDRLLTYVAASERAALDTDNKRGGKE